MEEPLKSVQNVQERLVDRSKHFHTVLYFWALLLYLELVFHLVMFQELTVSFLYPVLFVLSLGAILGIVCRLFPPLVNRILLVVFSLFFSMLFCAEVVYYDVFYTYFQLFGVLGVAGQVLDFLSIVWEAILENWLSMILLLVVPLLATIVAVVRWKGASPKRKIGHYVLIIGEAVLLYGAMILLILSGDRGINSPYDLYFNNLAVDDAIETLGVSTTTWLSARNTITGHTGSSTIYAETEEETAEEEEEPEEVVIDTSPNILDIDFDQILSDSGDDGDVKKLCNYMADKSGTNKNAYTGMFSGYNLIWITAEGFSGYCLSEEYTPTLWKMASQGFVFEHFYSPLYYGSTTGGEWSNLTGTVPNNGSYISMGQSGKQKIDMLFTAGRQANRLDYYVTGWHNNTYTYYDRDLSFPNMGYDWHGTDQGYEPEINPDTGKAYWPQSDVQLIEQSFPTYVDQEPFLAYYMTVSGHMHYSWGGNAMSKRNEESARAYAEENDLSYNEETLAYLAANKELDLAMETLLQDLKEAGIADRTLIVLSCDHVPYDDMEILDDLAGESLDAISKYANALMIYSPSMEEPVTVEKYCCSVDILPTVSNLMGWDYDSRMLVGSDILSDSEQFIMFPGLSYITDKVIYNAETDTVTNLTEASVDDDYLKSMKEKAQNWYTISDLLFATDFFQYVDPQLPDVSLETRDQIRELRMFVTKIQEPKVEEVPEEEETEETKTTKEKSKKKKKAKK